MVTRTSRLSNLSARVLATCERWLRPRLALGFGELNGQERRQEIVETLITELDIAAIVEAGTFRGTSTEWFARFGLPVLTIEVNPRFYHYARLRLRRFEHVTVCLGDAPQVLADEAQRGTFAHGRVLFYLDDHWLENLPLADDLHVIFASVPHHVVVIDDFEVPGDPGYSYDDYGPGRRLSIDYLDDLGLEPEPVVYFPSAPSSEETGCRRGTVLLTTDPEAAARLERMPQLRRFARARRATTPTRT
ncbi:MAG: hypothetical protein AAGC60_18755 [Acidobacteriota bacterium]